MNIQSMMKQAQKLQNEMLNEKKEIDALIFQKTNSFVTIKANGKKEIIEVKIDNENLDKDDVEMLQDIIIVTINSLFKEIDDETEKRMGKYTQGMPGLF